MNEYEVMGSRDIAEEIKPHPNHITKGLGISNGCFLAALFNSGDTQLFGFTLRGCFKAGYARKY
jgi:hypothetical protein